MKKTALITGITGQDGSYLAELLLSKGYHIYGLVRRSSLPNTERISHLLTDQYKSRFELCMGDLSDQSSLDRLIAKIQPDELYNLAAQSHVRESFDIPAYTADVTGLGTTRLLESIRRLAPECHFYQAGSSEMFGKVQEIPQRESTPFHPRSPYSVAKVYAHWLTVNYRESYNIHASNGILFNHESPRRGEDFVTRKITKAVACIAAGLQDKLVLGNLNAKRDWGYAPEYVEAMWMMLQQEKPGDYVIATGETHSVQEFVQEAFACAGLNWQDYVSCDAKFERPAEVDILIGDPSYAEKTLGWKAKTKCKGLVKIMVHADQALLRHEPLYKLG